MRYGPMTRSVIAVAVVSLGVAALPATAQASLLSDLLQPVVDLLGGGGGGSDNSGPGSAQDRLPDPPPPTAPPPTSPAPSPTPTSPAPSPAATPTAPPSAPASPGAGAPAPTGAPAPSGAPAAGGARRRRPVSPVPQRFLLRRHLLTPSPGKVLGGLRPTLRWRGGPARVDLYNVQIFTVTGRKVVSEFPRSRSLPVPAKRLAPGRRYVWRVWPYTRGHGYTKRPMAISWFATASRTVLSNRAR